ncbi:CHASE2 domain-containing protein [Hydrogenovibrio kuenenii]|uniref:CHASE2 domain-containing protein n=1 Tax=Hydrogenovibrio kuenenii TaxID=63658 RepID=UPI0004678DFF|nr:adenylate/guanylate cyclase domain-containing protein [Hydrogenovibrio kuenenii]
MTRLGKWKIFTHFSVIALGLTILLGGYLFIPQAFLSLDNRLRDFLFLARGPIPTTGQVVIVDLDDASLKKYGQWPWSRDLFAKLLQKLANDGAGIVGLDIVFSEADRTSPARLAKRYHFPDKNLPDFDQVMAKTLAQTPTILGYVFQMNTPTPGADAPNIPAIFIERGFSKNTDVLKPEGVLANIPILQNSAYSSGFFNNVPDESGMVRSVPLVMKYDGMIYPSLSLEMIRIATQVNKVYVNYSDLGVESIQLGKMFIPTDPGGRLFVNYRGPGHTFHYISAAKVLENKVDPKELEGKFILIGTSAAGLLDLRSMPFDNVYPGVEAHANVIDNILKGDFLTRPSWIIAADMLVISVTFLLSYLLLIRLNALWAFTIFLAEAVGLYYFYFHMLFTEGIVFNILFGVFALVAAFFFSLLVNFFFETRQKMMLRGKLSSKVSPAVMEEILKNEAGNVMEGDTREVTIFFSDVRNFTNISEALSNPQTLIHFLNEYMEPMTDVIVHAEGTVDKFIGDAIMAYWNAPIDVKDHADKAVAASLRQIAMLKDINEKIRQDERFQAVVKMSDANGVPPLDIGIGLNTGQAIVGEMGSAGRSDYTVIGDAINLGSRLESLCKFYNSKVTISNFTKEQLKQDYIFRFLDLVTVKGKTEPVEVWQVHDFGQAEGRMKEELDKHHHAIALYKQAKFVEAIDMLKDLESWPDKTNQNIYKIYIERCEHYIEEPPEDFNGVFIHKTKG